ncbi:hypothetical protein B0T10DRAFT_476582 [Thelonectria olida]|uniref:ADF-H domain-containing protein n=1 Tax=Thelonectria olida TaxID=1576542 RepID=A0A9P8WGZ7_9HYPO|nr:hypothetical protein B0T10DRAFT_476582 [Thelonectria olida]
MSTESTARKTVTVGGSREPWLVDDRAKTALRELQDGELLQLTVDYSEGEIQYVKSCKQVAPDSVGGYFAAPSPQTFSFYRYPGSGAVILIWTRYHLASSTKRTHLQNGLRRDLASTAEREGIKAVHMLQVSSQKDITGDCLRQAISSSATEATMNLE